MKHANNRTEHMPGDQQRCKECNQIVIWKPIAVYKERTLYGWSDCRCTAHRIAQSRATIERAQHALRQSSARGTQSDLEVLHAYPAPADGPALRAALAWFDTARATGASAPADNNPCPALYLLDEHGTDRPAAIAARIASMANDHGLIVVSYDTTHLINRLEALDAAERESLIDLAGRHAWLTVLLDLGATEQPTAWQRDVLHDIINRRWHAAGWTLFTSRYTPDELADNGSIAHRTMQRLDHMTAERIVQQGD